MYYKILNKNVITAALVSLMTLSVAKNCEAQGAVSLVEEENIELPQDNALNGTGNVANASDEAFDEFGFDVDAEIPDVLEEDDGVIPLDSDSMISPAQAVEVAEPVAPVEPVAIAEPVAPVAVEPVVEVEPVVATEPVIAAVPQAPVAVAEPVAPVAAAMPVAPVAPVAPVVVNNVPAAPVAPMAPVMPVAPQNQIEDDFDLGLVDTLPDDVLPQAPVMNNAAPLAVSNNNPLFANTGKAPVAKAAPKNQFANSVLAKIDNDLFSQMSDIEKQTTLLTLELRREKIRSEIEAIKAQRTKAEEEKLAAQEEKKRQEFEWKKEQEAKVLREQQALVDKEIELEKTRQRKALNAYMNQMLEQNQKWIKENAALYKRLKEVEDDRKSLVDDFKGKVDDLNTLSSKLVQKANSAKNNHDRTVASLTAQNIQLKKRIEAEAKAAAEAAKNAQNMQAAQANQYNTGAATSEDASLGELAPLNITQLYAILDISGKGENLVAKLINKEGDAFAARKGTVLQTGHVVEEITHEYIKFNHLGIRSYLYTNSSFEPAKIESEEAVKEAPKVVPFKTTGTKSSSSAMGEKGIPSLGSGMFVK